MASLKKPARTATRARRVQQLADARAKLAGAQEALAAAVDEAGDDGLPSNVAALRAAVTACEGDIANYELAITRLDAKIADDEKALVARLDAQRKAHAAAELSKSLAIGDDVANLIGQLAPKIQQLISTRREIGAAWALPGHEAEAGLLTPPRILSLIGNELFRHSAPLGLEFPRSQCPDVMFRLQPDKIRPFTDALREGTDYALARMQAMPAPAA